MLMHPTLDQLRALQLNGMLKALQEQEALPDLESLSFLERLALLLDRETPSATIGGSPPACASPSSSSPPPWKTWTSTPRASSTGPWCGPWPPATGSRTT